MNKISAYFKTICYHSNFLFSFKILLGLAGSTFVPWYLGELNAVVPVTLGVVAAAVTDIDVRPLKKLLYIVMTLIGFGFAAASVELLFPYPLFFVLGLIFSAFFFTMIGVLGKRFNVMAFGALLMGAYTMLSHGLFPQQYELTFYLSIGAAWYFFIAFIENLFQPIRAVESAIAECFYNTARFLDAKATFFDPDEKNHFQKQFAQITQLNDELVTSLNAARFALFDHLKLNRQNTESQKMLNDYFLLQDIHERINANYGHYEALSQQFKHSDVLFRFARILNLQAKECVKLSVAIKYRSDYEYDSTLNDYFGYLQTSLRNQEQTSLTQSLFDILDNLNHINWLFSHVNNVDEIKAQYQESDIAGDSIGTLPEIWNRIKQNMTIQSGLFRHAIRMSLVFAAGYGIIQLTHLPHGYWVVLTSLFVCQPNYSTTKHRLILRTIGTIGGILIGIPLMFLLPTIPAQLVLIILSGWLFFLFKNSQYAYATVFVTLLVFFSFGLLGESSLEVAEWRLVATLIGCFIAFLAVNFIWPDWHFRNIPTLIQRCCEDDCHYLCLIGQQYHAGKNNEVNYRLIRRKVHDDNADLAALLSIMQKEPNFNEEEQNKAFRFITLNYTFISYLSALSTHRDQKLSAQTAEIFDALAAYIVHVMHSNWNAEEYQQQQNSVTQAMNAAPKDAHDLFVLQQFALILELMPELIAIKNGFENALTQPVK